MKLPIKNWMLLALMLLSAGLAVVLRPTISIADELPPINLKAMVPTAFGDWKESLNISNQIVDPQQKELLDKIYNETLTRTYINNDGYRIMLSIAYGKNQSNDLQLHKPEICYPAQGFSLLMKTAGTVNLMNRPVAVSLLETSLGQRYEPITYWTTVGSRITTNQTNKKLAEIRYAVAGRIPDGMLVRISSIDKSTSNAYLIQRQFASEMINAIAPEHRARFAGSPDSNN